MATAKPNEGQTYSNSPGYSINEHGYQYDDRYGNYDANTDYTAKMNRAVQGGNNKAAAYYEAMANKKVQDLYANNPKYHTQNNYGSYLNQISDSYLNYLQGKSNDAYTVDSNTASMLGRYDRTRQYSADIDAANKAGDYKKAAVLEYLMNQKIKGENLPYIQQDNYSSYLNGISQSDINMALYGADVTPTNRYYKVNPDGHSPKGLQVGDYVVTGGGTYMITGPWSDEKQDYTGAVKVDGGTTTSNYKGTYSTPSSVLQQQGIDTAAQKAANPEEFTTLQAPDTSAYQLNAFDPGDVDVTSNSQIPALRDVFMPNRITEADLNQFLDEKYGLAQQQLQNQIQYATETGEENYRRAYEDALPTYAAQRGQADLEGNKSAKNAALYAEQRGDRGGIGAAQYNALQIAKANQLNQINTAQNKLASDTARSIADLRRQGNFEMADKMLTLAQDYLSQMNENKKWIANYDVTLSQLDMQARNAEREDLYNQMAVTGRTPDGGYTMEGNRANLDAKLNLANLFGTYNGMETVPFQTQKLQLAMQLGDTYGVDPYGNTTLTGRQYLDSKRANYANLYGVDPVTGQKTMQNEQRLTDNYYNLWQTLGYDPVTGLQTLQNRQAEFDNSMTNKNYALELAQALIANGGIPSADTLSAAGITNPQEQTGMQWGAQYQAILNRLNLLNTLGVDLSTAMGYPSTAPGVTPGSVTSGGGVGTSTSSGGSGGSGGSGSSKKGSGGNKTPAPAPAANTNTKVDAVTGAQPGGSGGTNIQSVRSQINNLLKYT